MGQILNSLRGLFLRLVCSTRLRKLCVYTGYLLLLVRLKKSMFL
jgi:hypothetical protein